MNRIILSSALVTMLAMPALASEGTLMLDEGMKAKITQTLTDQGYEVRKIQIEDGAYEAYAIKGGKTYEIYMDRDLKILRTDD
ncbi:PepSY domain-containing protein [Sagittula salina]|uniref:PepSY domain-containing protein n=1 Tax=Sagittula salina TaxID=2820268 RepID=A0A940MPF7_9RHOB|nr:PepSY domain-containing protein [Sagittula salina]MBP0483054.1 PepSY domain-containing protein [Sagittula salina]